AAARREPRSRRGKTEVAQRSGGPASSDDLGGGGLTPEITLTNRCGNCAIGGAERPPCLDPSHHLVGSQRSARKDPPAHRGVHRKPGNRDSRSGARRVAQE